MSEIVCGAVALAVGLPVSAGMSALKKKLKDTAANMEGGQIPGKKEY